jgi:hypothetical protein
MGVSIGTSDKTQKGDSQPLVWPERQLPVPVIEIAPLATGNVIDAKNSSSTPRCLLAPA